MQIQLRNIKQENIIFFDIEYDRTSLVQIASLILSLVEPNIYELRKSINIYIKPDHSVSSFFIRYTNITNEFLCDNGVDLPVARALVKDALFDVNLNSSLFISHGVKGDLEILRQNGFDIDQISNTYCTYTMAKQDLNRDNHLTLHEIAAEDGYFMFNEHNAFADV